MITKVKIIEIFDKLHTVLSRNDSIDIYQKAYGASVLKWAEAEVITTLVPVAPEPFLEDKK